VTGVVEREATWYLSVVGTCVGVVLVLLVTSFLAPYYMWKNRVILIMKIVHYFQAYEDDGNSHNNKNTSRCEKSSINLDIFYIVSLATT